LSRIRTLLGGPVSSHGAVAGRNSALADAGRGIGGREAVRSRASGRIRARVRAAELALEKKGIAVAVVLERLCEKRFEMVADDGVEDGRLGLTAAVAGAERRAGCARMALVLDPGRPCMHPCMQAAFRIAHSQGTRSGSGPVRSAHRAARQNGGLQPAAAESIHRRIARSVTRIDSSVIEDLQRGACPAV